MISRLKIRIKTAFASPLFLKSLAACSLILTLITILAIYNWGYWKTKYRELEKETYYRGTTALTPTSRPTLEESQNVSTPPCANEGATLFTGVSRVTGEDKQFAACFENGRYNIYRKTKRGYEKFYFNETGRLDTENYTLISYPDYPDPSGDVYKADVGSRVFKVDKTNPPNFGILLDPQDIPNKDMWISGLEYSVQYFIPDADWVLSPGGDVVLLEVASCSECEAATALYSYNFKDKELIYIGMPYVGDASKDEPRYFIQWIDSHTLKWREGDWRMVTQEESSEECGKISAAGGTCPPYDMIRQDDLGYKLTTF